MAPLKPIEWQGDSDAYALLGDTSAITGTEPKLQAPASIAAKVRPLRASTGPFGKFETISSNGPEFHLIASAFELPGNWPLRRRAASVVLTALSWPAGARKFLQPARRADESTPYDQ